MPSKEMQGAMKVVNDALQKNNNKIIKNQLKSATNIIQQEWFNISSCDNANPLDVEDYLDCFEDISYALLQYIVNMTDASVSKKSSKKLPKCLIKFIRETRRCITQFRTETSTWSPYCWTRKCAILISRTKPDTRALCWFRWRKCVQEHMLTLLNDSSS